MDAVVDLSNLRLITGGDRDLEAELFREFLRSSDECVELLRKAKRGDDPAAWGASAHALKGICVNLGATHLGTLCHAAQGELQSSCERKKELLEQIECELERVREILAKTLT